MLALSIQPDSIPHEISQHRDQEKEKLAHESLIDINENVLVDTQEKFPQSVPLCFCSETSHRCSDCKSFVCNMCSPNPDSDSRMCPNCFYSYSMPILQTDGGLSGSDSDEEVLQSRLRNRRVIVDSDDEDKVSEDSKDDKPEDSDDDIPEDSGGIRTIKDKVGRAHMPYPSNGKSFVFLKSNQFDPSTIETLPIKKVFVFVVDNGADYGIRSAATMHYFGKLFFKLDLDLLIVVKNAPKDSRYNPIEHLWGYLTPKLAGMVLPTKLIDERKEDESLDADSPQVLDQAIDIVKNTMEGKRFNSFSVVPVAVHCNSDTLVIGDKQMKQKTFDDLEEVTDYYDSNLSKERLRHKNQELMEESKLIHKHMDKRTYCIFYRKCMTQLGDQSC